MSRPKVGKHRVNLPTGDKPIVNYGIVKTRFSPNFRAADGRTGQFYELVQAVGMRLKLQPEQPPYIVLNQQIIGAYDSGTEFQVNKATLFTNTSKMPGPSFAIPAGPPAFGGTCPASALGDPKNARVLLEQQTGLEIKRVRLPVLQGAVGGIEPDHPTTLGDAEGANAAEKTTGLTTGVSKSYAGDGHFTCSSCYALAGNYNYPSKQINDMMHLAWIEYELSQGGPQRLGQALAYAIQHVNITRREGFQPYFRIHDAGDFHKEDYLEAWVVCASMMTHMQFWAPTRQWVFQKWVPLLVSAQQRVMAAGGWLVIRPSSLRFYDPAPVVEGLSAGSGVSCEDKDPCIWTCPVYNKIVPKAQPDGSVQYEEAASCLEASCTACWNQPQIAVSYGAH